MLEEWKPMVFEVFPWKATKTYIVRKTDAIMTLLDEQIVKTQTMRGSPYIKPIEGKAKKWEARLQNMTAILEEWLTCQKTWLYLEPIFSSDDIIRQMPTETRRFQSVDQFWRRLMDTAKRTPNLFDLQSEVENLQKNLNSSNEMLDQIMKGLNDYLSAKCLQFPRFFFLSNDELLSILSQTKDPKAVQPHMNKCFEGISLLDFKRDLKIIAMMSAQDERVEFNEVIDPDDGPRKGNVELWLRDVERVMRESLKSILCKSFDAYDEDKRTNWIVSGLWPGQIVLAVAQTMWTFHCEAAINSGGPKALRGYVETMNKQLSKIVDLVRGKLGRMERLTIGALVVIDVHARDVTQKLAEEGLTDVNDFDWLAQLRYYFHDKLLNTRMINAELAYGYEYLGNSDRLVITPLTDRCYRTLMGALHLHLGMLLFSFNALRSNSFADVPLLLWCLQVVHLKVRPELARPKRSRIWPRLLPSNASCSTALTV
jgi:dynein heavy chain